ncbi:MAG TPA: FAD-linked oxidase C-terminal domain-containing protein [Syntrophomonadaceae bacterium]|nr:FAD-linked oxidase C-terminal domain-containing protein [Syntrophomonadaceae bacterium]HPR93907.1 FAD-linked oxidase C-terminal domain-containing protein [Syntrophomonadaceae bacterium]
MQGLVKDLTGLLGSALVLSQTEEMLAYANDATHYFKSRIPDAVVLPQTTEDVSKVMKYAFTREIPVTPRGAGSGLAGGCTPVHGGIVMDLKRMDHILEIAKNNMTAKVEAGVVLKKFQDQLEKQKLFYPPDPQSASVCTIGGNVATRAGGPRGVKYGTTGNYVTGLEVVLPDGSIINPGGKFVKQSVGYDITHLMTGSEGTLGVITGVNLRLLPLPEANRTIVVVCESLEQAAEIVAEIIARGAIPGMIEFMIKLAITVMNNFFSPPLPTDGEGYLFMYFDGTESQVEYEAKLVTEICHDMKAKEVRLIEDKKAAQTYWTARANVYPLIQTIFQRATTEDITVPRNKLPDLVRAVQAIAAEEGVMIGLAGHAGDGNMHPSVLFSQVTPELLAKAEIAIDRLTRAGLDMGGTISGEHGIGIHKARYLSWELGDIQIELMKRIKQAFDPKGIMNPGKLWLEGGGGNV